MDGEVLRACSSQVPGCSSASGTQGIIFATSQTTSIKCWAMRALSHHVLLASLPGL